MGLRNYNKIDVFNNIEIIKDIKKHPILFIHKKNDVMFNDVYNIYKKCIDRKQIVVNPFWLKDESIHPVFGMRYEHVIDFDTKRPRFIPRKSYWNALKSVL